MDETLKVQIEAFLKPSSVAVVGASDRIGSWGSILMNGLKYWDFPGALYPVNQKAETVGGLRAYPDLEAIPGPVDLALLAVPAEVIRETVLACARKKIRAVAVIAAGFGEAVEGGREQELELAAIARANGMRILGPNVSGAFNLHARFNASAAPPNRLHPTAVSAVCQGSYAIYDLVISGYWRKMGIGQFVQTGNECDLDVNDFLEYFGEDPRTGAVVMYLETLRNVKRFREVAGRVARQKPVIVQKVGRTPGGARAARSHTGALAGDHSFYEGLFRQLRIVQSPSMERLIPLGNAFLKLPAVKGDRVAIITMGGSWGVALTDLLEERGLRVPELGTSVQGALRELGLPARASTRNPIDIGAAASVAFSPGAVEGMARAVLSSGEVDALVLHGFGRLAFIAQDPESTQIIVEMEKEVMRSCARLQEKYGLPVLIASAVLPSHGPAVREVLEEGVTVYHQLEEIADILALKRGYDGSTMESIL
ncbi:MAG: CoA-binding protein [Deltaproteobacteria bacterium]|nr:CoA-binding protein [Deltaproteobacteria bacterium]